VFKFPNKLATDTVKAKEKIAEEEKVAALTAAVKPVFSVEEKSRPLTDDSIKQLLADKGMRIKRRTVASYRKELDILPYNERVSV